MTTVIERPLPPADGECCESACTPCVWDFYYEALAIWQAQQDAIKAAETEEKAD
ncbi:MAG: oxidoreductase-like domain-containing protein [Pontibacterium sp.]